MNLSLVKVESLLLLGQQVETCGWKNCLLATLRCVWSNTLVSISHLLNGMQTGPKVLHNLSFHIQSGEHIGVGKKVYFVNHKLFSHDHSRSYWKWKGTVTAKQI